MERASLSGKKRCSKIARSRRDGVFVLFCEGNALVSDPVMGNAISIYEETFADARSGVQIKSSSWVEKMERGKFDLRRVPEALF